MFSRLSLRTISHPNLIGLSVRTAQSSVATSGGSQESVITYNGQTYKIKEGPERDLVNFPRPVPTDFTPPVRHVFIPESWFTFFYKKTGATGPYTLAFTLGTYLISKEIYVLEHEFYGGISCFILIAAAIKYLKKPARELFEKDLKEEDKMYDEMRDGKIRMCQESIQDEKTLQRSIEGELLLVEAKKENVDIQLETAYRERLDIAFKEIKRRLDYQVEVLNINRRIAHKHMISWIISNVLKSITPQQEKESLDKCIADLKTLAAAAK